MVFTEHIVFGLEILGVVICSVLGAIESINRRLDAFGVLFCSIVSALGGGIVRDLLLGRVPPIMFTNHIYVTVAAICSLITFALVYFLGKGGATHLISHRAVIALDAAGLAAFTVVGIDTAVLFGHGENPFFVIFLGMTTAVGGGIARDILLSKIPDVFTKHIYAVASIFGGILYYLLSHVFHLEVGICVAVCIASVMLLRILASFFHWNFPKIQ